MTKIFTKKKMPSRRGTNSNPYLLPVYQTARHPCYKPPRNHVAARALMNVVGAAEIKSEDFLKIMDFREAKEKQQQQQQEENFDEEDEEEEEEEEEEEQKEDFIEGKQQQKQQQNQNSSSFPRLRITQAKQFADHHRVVCPECRQEHFSILDRSQKKIFRQEYTSREKLINEESEIRKNEIKLKYMERHIQILRYLEATRRQRLRALRQAQREEAQRKFDAEENAARSALMEQIFYVDLNRNLIEVGAINILNYIITEERIARKDYYRVQRAERHLVTIASHLRAEKVRRVEGALFTLVKSEPTARRLLYAEYERAVQKMTNWFVEGKEIVSHVEQANRLRAEAAERDALDKREIDARSTDVVSVEILAREELTKMKNADRFRIYSAQLAVKKQELEVNEVVARRQSEMAIWRQRVQLFLKMLPSIEAGKRLEVRIEAWEELKEIACEYQMSLE